MIFVVVVLFFLWFSPPLLYISCLGDEKKKTTSFLTSLLFSLCFSLSLYSLHLSLIYLLVFPFSHLSLILSFSFFCFFIHLASLTYLLVKQCSWGGPFSYSLFSFLNLFIYPSLLLHIYWSNNVVGEMTLPPLNWEIWAKGSQLVDNEPNVLFKFHN